MNNKGFTLIELLVTITLLGIIVTISFVSINGVIKKGKIEDCKNIVDSIKSATSEYVSDNRYNNAFIAEINDYKMTIDASTLLNNNYLKGEIINPYTKQTINSSNISILIFFNSDYTMRGAIINGPTELITSCKIVANEELLQDPITNNPDNPTDDGSIILILNGNGATNNGSTSVKAIKDSASIDPGTIILPQRKYTITYDANGTGATVPSPSVVSYTFDGWYDDTVGTNLIINNSANLSYSNNSVSGYISDGKWIGNNGKTLYAKWIESSVRLGKMEYASHMCMWNTKADGTGYNYNADQEVSITEDITLYAKCKMVCCHAGLDDSCYGSGFCHFNYGRGGTECLKVINGEKCDSVSGWVECGNDTYYAIDKPCEDAEPGCPYAAPCTNGTYDVNCNCIPSGGGGGGGGGPRVNIVQ